MSVQMVKQYVSGRLRRLRSLPEHPQKAALATMRKGIGHAPGELPELWGEFLLDLPEEMLQGNHHVHAALHKAAVGVRAKQHAQKRACKYANQEFDYKGKFSLDDSHDRPPKRYRPQK